MGWLHGSNVTITGTGFGSKGVDPRPLVWAPLRGTTNPHPQLSRWTSGWWTAPFAQSGTMGGSECAVWNMGNDYNGAGSQDSNGFQINMPTPPAKFYGRAKHRLDFNPRTVAATLGDLNHKIWRSLGDPNLAAGVINCYANWHHDAFGDGFVGVENSTTPGGYNDTVYPELRWNDEEFMYKNSTPNTADGTLRFYMNNVLFGGNGYNQDAMQLSSTSSPGIVVFGVYDDLANVVQPAIVPTWNVGYRDIYYDDTWARVVVGDNAVYGNCTSTEIQIPTAWTNTSISVVVNCGQFESLAGKWVFVFDANNTIIHSEQIPDFTQAIIKSIGTIGQNVSYGPITVPVGSTSVNIRISRTTGSLTLAEVAQATLQISLDGGTTWGSSHSVGARGGDIQLKRNGSILGFTEAQFQLPQPSNVNRRIRGQLKYLQAIDCGLQYRFD